MSANWFDATSEDHKFLQTMLSQLQRFRQRKEFDQADCIRQKLLRLDPGFKLRMTHDRIVLEHWPVPLFSLDQFKGLNFGLYITDSDALHR